MSYSNQPEVPPKMTDSEFLATMIVAAYTEQRYELGEALARLCGQAYRMERDREMAPAVPVNIVPYAAPDPGTCLYPVVPGIACGETWEWHKATVRDHPFADSSQVPIVRPVSPALTAVPEEPPTEVTPVVPSARCIALVGGKGRERECHGVLYWQEGRANPDGWTAAGWHHLNGPNEDGHEPIPDRPLS